MSTLDPQARLSLVRAASERFAVRPNAVPLVAGHYLNWDEIAPDDAGDGESLHFNLERALRDLQSEHEYLFDPDEDEEEGEPPTIAPLDAQIAELEHEQRMLRVRAIAERTALKPEAVRVAVELLDWSQLEFDEPDYDLDEGFLTAAMHDLGSECPWLFISELRPRVPSADAGQKSHASAAGEDKPGSKRIAAAYRDSYGAGGGRIS